MPREALVCRSGTSFRNKELPVGSVSAGLLPGIVVVALCGVRRAFDADVERGMS
jgi:hypothetical protein